MFFYVTLAEGPGVARDKKFLKKLKKLFRIFLAHYIPRPPLSVHKKFPPSRSSRLVGYNQPTIYTCLVLGER